MGGGMPQLKVRRADGSDEGLLAGEISPDHAAARASGCGQEFVPAQRSRQFRPNGDGPPGRAAGPGMAAPVAGMDAQAKGGHCWILSARRPGWAPAWGPRGETAISIL